MQIITHSHETGERPLVAGIGFFDGVHRGHRYLIDRIVAEARTRNRASAVVTFREHPRKELNRGSHLGLLNSLQEKLDMLSATHPDYCILLDFTVQLSQLSAEQFLAYLYRDFQVRSLVIGYDHRFGHNRAEGFEQYIAYGKCLGMEILPAARFAPEGQAISSSRIRRLISEEGDVCEAMRLLSYPYRLKGHIVEGDRIGRTLGFPTANLQLVEDKGKALPRPGAYAVQVRTNDGVCYDGMLNFGKRPTVKEGNPYTIEVHLFGFQGDLYGSDIEVFFYHFMRPEMPFASLDELKLQLQKDQEQAQALLSPNHP